MYTGDIDFRVLHFDHLASSNIHAQELIKAGDIAIGDVIWTDHQIKGKGQQSSRWDSNPSENLLFSVYLQLNWPADQLFQLNMLASLAVYDLLDNLAVKQIKIKWPNDILINSQKICGILIENSIKGSKAMHTVVGFGLNVNQLEFPKFQREATSIASALGSELDRKEVLYQLLDHLKDRLKQMTNRPAKLLEDYQAKLYGLGRSMEFESRQERFKAEILGVNQDGKLLLNRDGMSHAFDMKEIRFLD